MDFCKGNYVNSRLRTIYFLFSNCEMWDMLKFCGLNYITCVLCSIFQQTSFMVIRMQSGSHCHTVAAFEQFDTFLLCHVPAAHAKFKLPLGSNFRWIFLFQIASLKISNDIRPPQNSSGITHPSLQYILKRILVSTCLHSWDQFHQPL